MTGETLPKGFRCGMPARPATKTSVVQPGGRSRQHVVCREDLRGGSVLSVQREQGEVGLLAHRVDFEDPVEAYARVLRPALRVVPLCQGEMAGGVLRMPLREGTQEGLPSRLMLQPLKRGVHIPKRQMQVLWSEPRQLFPDAEAFAQLALVQQEAAQLEGRLCTVGVKGERGSEVCHALAEIPRSPR